MCQEDDDQRTAILLNGTLNHNVDMEDILRRASSTSASSQGWR